MNVINASVNPTKWKNYVKKKLSTQVHYAASISAFCGDLDHTSLFSPSQGARHAFAENVGKNVANPTAILLCASNMLHHLNLDYHSQLIRDAVRQTVKEGKVWRLREGEGWGGGVQIEGV